MADGDHYAGYSDVQQLLSNSGIGIAGNTLYNDTSLEIALDISLAKIHNYLGIRTTTKLTNAVDVLILKGIQIELIHMRILQSRSLKENNLADHGAIQGYWSIMPDLTRGHIRQLDEVLANNDGVAWTFDTRTGYELT